MVVQARLQSTWKNLAVLAMKDCDDHIAVVGSQAPALHRGLHPSMAMKSYCTACCRQ